MLPRRFERSTVQNCCMMSFASSEILGSFGKWTGLETILERVVSRDDKRKRGAADCLYISMGF